MASRPGTITISKPAVSADAEERHEEKRPRNLPPVDVTAVGFALMVDGKAKSHFDNAKAATEAGLTLKRAFPVVQVVVYDAVEKTRTLIELPGGSPAKE
jgi:hypothetical protein